MKAIGLDPADGPALLAEILEDLPAFWDRRDLRALHHPFWLRQCAADSLVVRGEASILAGYLLGVVTARGLAYIHLVAVRNTFRRRGIGALLYSAFFRAAERRDAKCVEAITTPTNTGSIAFHQQFGFTAEVVPDYGGPDQPRVFFRRPLAARGLTGSTSQADSDPEQWF